MNIFLIVVGLITIFIGVLVHASFAPEIVDAVNTDTCASDLTKANTSGCPLENASTTAKVIYGIEELSFGLIGLFLALAGSVSILVGMGVKLPGMGK